MVGTHSLDHQEHSSRTHYSFLAEAHSCISRIFGIALLTIINPILYLVGGYFPWKAREVNQKDLELIGRVSMLKEYTKIMAPVFGAYKSQTLLVPDNVRWIVNLESDLVATITNHTVTRVIRNLIDCSVKDRRDQTFPLAAIARVVVNTLCGQREEKTLEKAMGELLYRNRPEEIPAPYPINNVIFGDIAFYFGSKTVERLTSFCNIEKVVDAMSQTKEGSLPLDLATTGAAQIVKQIEANGAELKQSTVNVMLGCFEPDDPRRNLFGQWLTGQFDEVIREGTLAAPWKFAGRWIEAVLVRAAYRLENPDFMRVLKQDLVNLLDEKIEPDLFVDTLFKRFELENGVGLGLDEQMLIALNPALKKCATEWLLKQKKSLPALCDWIRKMEENQKNFNSDEKELIQLVGNYTLEQLANNDKSIAEEIVKQIGLRHENQDLIARLIAEFPDTKDPLGNWCASRLKLYIKAAASMVVKKIKKTIARHEQKSPDALTIHVLNHLLRHTRTHIASMNGVKKSGVPSCEALTQKMIHFIDLKESDLPVPSEWKKSVWNLLTEQEIPRILKQLFETYLTRDSLNRYIADLIRQQQKAPEQSTASPRLHVPEETRQLCIGIVEDLSVYFKSGLVELFATDEVKINVAMEMAQALIQQCKNWPMSLVYQKCLPAIIHLLSGCEEEFKELDDFHLVHERTASQEIKRYIGKTMKRQVKSAFKGRMRQIQKGLTSGFDAAFKYAGGFLYETGADAVDIFTYCVSDNLFPEEGKAQIIRSGSQSFLLIGEAPTSEQEEEEWLLVE